MNNADGPTLASGSWGGGEGREVPGLWNPSEASCNQAPASQFCKSTTFLAKSLAGLPQASHVEVWPATV